MADRRRKKTDIEEAKRSGQKALEDAKAGKIQRVESENEVRGFAEIPYLQGGNSHFGDTSPSVAIDTPIIPQNRDISWEAEQRARALEANRQMLNYYHDVMREENASRNAQRRREAGQSEVLGSRRAQGESTLTNAAKNEIAGLEQKRDRLLKYDGVYGNDRKAQAIQNQIDEIKNNGHASNENYLVSRNRYDSLMSDSELANDIDKLTQIIYNPRRAGGNASANAVSQRLTEMDAQDYIDSLSSKYGLNEDELRDMALTRHSEDRYSRSDEYSENLYDFAKKHPKLGEAASVLDTFGNSVEGAYNLAAGTLTNDNRYLSDAFRDTKQGLRQGVIDSHKTGLGRTVSQLKMGLEDLGLGVLTGNAPLMLAGQTANEAMLDSVENGQTARRGALYGGLSGAADYYMNKVGLDAAKEQALDGITSVGVKNILQRLGIAAGAEAGENVLQDITQSFLDEFVNGERSELKRAYASKLAEGMSESEAFKDVAKEYAQQLLMSGATGAVMGAGMYGGTYALNGLKGRSGDIPGIDPNDPPNPPGGGTPEIPHMDPADLARQNEIDVNEKVDSVNRAVNEINDLAKQIPEVPEEVDPNNVVYHSGILSRLNKAETRGMMHEGLRDTGYYGTGHYFVDGAHKNELDNGSKYKSQPYTSVDISKYNNLYKVMSDEQATDLHKFSENYMRYVNGHNDKMFTETDGVRKVVNESEKAKYLDDLYAQFRRLFPEQNTSKEEFLNQLESFRRSERDIDSDDLSDSTFTQLMKSMGYNGVDTRGTSSADTRRGIVIYDLDENSVLQSNVRDKAVKNGLMNSFVRNEGQRLFDLNEDRTIGDILDKQRAEARRTEEYHRIYDDSLLTDAENKVNNLENEIDNLENNSIPYSESLLEDEEFLNNSIKETMRQLAMFGDEIDYETAKALTLENVQSDLASDRERLSSLKDQLLDAQESFKAELKRSRNAKKQAKKTVDEAIYQEKLAAFVADENSENGHLLKSIDDNVFLKNDDLDDYVNAGTDPREAQSKRYALNNKENIIIHSAKELRDKISSIVHSPGDKFSKRAMGIMRVGDSISSQIKEYDPNFDTSKCFFQLVPNDIMHAFLDHTFPKNGYDDLPMNENDMIYAISHLNDAKVLGVDREGKNRGVHLLIPGEDGDYYTLQISSERKGVLSLKNMMKAKKGSMGKVEDSSNPPTTSLHTTSNSNVPPSDGSVNPDDGDDGPDIPPSSGGGGGGVPGGGGNSPQMPNLPSVPKQSLDAITKLENAAGSNGIVPPNGGRDIPSMKADGTPGDKLSRYATNTMRRGTNLTPEEYAEQDLSQFMYESKTEKQSMEDAFRMIEEEGADNLKARLMAEEAKDLTQSETDALMSLIRTNNATIRALRFEGKLDEAAALRAETTAMNKKVRQQASSNAQGLQALAKWTRNTPEGMLMHAENIVNGNVKVEKSALQEALDKLKRSRKDVEFSPEFEDKFLEEAEKLMEIGDMDSREAKDIMARLGRLVNEQIPVKLNEKLQAFLMDNMLGNFRTLITRNAGGNVGLNVMEQTMTRPLAAGLDRLVAKKTGKRTQAGMSKEALAEYMQGFVKGLSDEAHDFKTGLHTARTGENTLDEAIRANRHVFKSKFFDKRDSLIKNGLSVGDRPFYEATYKQTLGDYNRLRKAGVMGDDIQNLSDESFKQYADMAASLNALAAVYQNNSTMSKALLGLKEGIGDLSEGMLGFDILSQFSMPFVKTPANVVDRAIDYSPLGFVRNAVRTAKEGGIGGENFDQNRFVNETARNIIGTALMGGATAAAANGVMSGAYSDDKDKAKAQKESGMQEYALNLPGNLQMDIGWIPVVGSNAVAAAAGYNAYKDYKDEGLGQALMKGLSEGGQSLVDQSMFQGLQRLFGTGESYNSEGSLPENLINVVKSGLGQAIPSLMRQSAQVTDKYQRDLGSSNKGASFGIMDNYDLNSLANNIPVLRELVLNPKVNAQGELVEESQGRGFGARVLEDMFLPGKITQLQDNRLSDEAQRISDVTGNAKAYMPRASRSKVDTEDHTLSNKEWLDYQQKYGKEMTAAGNMVMDSDAYRAADDATKEKMLDDIYSTVASAINSDYNGKDIDKAAQKYKEEGLEGLQEYLDAKYNPYGLDKDTYTKLKDAGEDLSVYEGYGDALEEYGLNDNADNRECWKQAGADGLQAIAYYNQSFIDAGMDKAYTSKSAYQAFNDGKLEEYKEYRDYLKANGLQDSEKRWNEYQQSGISTSSSGQGFRQEVATTDQSSQQSEVAVDPITQIQNSGVKINALDSAWAKASNANPGITPEDFINTWSAIDANNNGNFTKDEWVNFLNASGLDPQSAEPYFDMYYNNSWNKLKYSNGSWKK